MLIAKCLVPENNIHNVHLCIIPHSVSLSFPPVKVSLLEQTDGAIFWVGPGESIKVEINQAEKARIISSIRPAILYITASTGTQPGIKVPSIKVVYDDNGKESLFFMNTANEWKAFSALEERN